MTVKTGNPGDPITVMGCVLMSCSKERWAEIEQFGDYGETGQAAADALEQRILDRRAGVVDLMRGLHGAKLGIDEYGVEPLKRESA